VGRVTVRSWPDFDEYVQISFVPTRTLPDDGQLVMLLDKVMVVATFVIADARLLRMFELEIRLHTDTLVPAGCIPWYF
jgi:hypothetical protein